MEPLVLVGAGVGLGTGVLVAVGAGVAVGDGVLVGVGELVGLGLGTCVAVAGGFVGAAVAVAVTTAVLVGAGVLEAWGAGVLVAAGAFVDVGATVGVLVDVGAAVAVLVDAGVAVGVLANSPGGILAAAFPLFDPLLVCPEAAFTDAAKLKAIVASNRSVTARGVYCLSLLNTGSFLHYYSADASETAPG